MFAALLVFCGVQAQNASKAKQILDKVAANLNNQGGAKADFTLSSEGIGSLSGSIFIKGKKFHATTPKASIWFDGKTQWTYMTSSEEVNVSTPNESQQAQMNPYKFITLYKNGYRLGVKDQSNGWEVHLTALNRDSSCFHFGLITPSAVSSVRILVRSMRQSVRYPSFSSYKARSVYHHWNRGMISRVRLRNSSSSEE